VPIASNATFCARSFSTRSVVAGTARCDRRRHGPATLASARWRCLQRAMIEREISRASLMSGAAPALSTHRTKMPVTAPKSRACREERTSAPCRWLSSAAWPMGDVKSLKTLQRYNVLKTPAAGGITVWKWPAAFLEEYTSGPCPSLFSAARVRSEFSADT
jgi:hypothetical protein